MNCPQCNEEMAEFASGDDRVHVCAECGEWVDGAQLNALLLHTNLPGVASLGGRVAPDQATGTCPTSAVSQVRVEQGTRGTDNYYEMCEDCGSIFLPFDPPAATDFEGARARLVEGIKRFTAKKSAASK